MASKSRYSRQMIAGGNYYISPLRSIIETAFYGNNVEEVKSLKEAYELALNSPGTIVSDQEIKDAEKYGLEKASKILVFNDGKELARRGDLRRDYRDGKASPEEYERTIRETLYKNRGKKFYRATVYIGMHRDFMVKAHLMISQGSEAILFNWMLNFQALNPASQKAYQESLRFKDEGDIFLLALPEICPDDYPEGLSLYDGQSNVGFIGGLKFFAEYKKGSLSLAWAIAERNNYLPFHAGQKKVYLPEEKEVTCLYVGLTGSGKSIFMNHKHPQALSEDFLHDDALMISLDKGLSMSLEPSYYEKTKDMRLDLPIMDYILSAQNQGVTLDESGKKIITGWDLRNDNGRVILAQEAHENRVLYMENPPNIIFWLMRDPVLPPVLKVTCWDLALAFGASLSNINIKHSDSDLIKEAEPLTIQPFGNPFSTYPARKDYDRLRELIESYDIEVYILNTGYFMGIEIPKKVSLPITDNIIAGRGDFVAWNDFEDLQIMEIAGYKTDFDNINYKNYFRARIRERIAFLEKHSCPALGIKAMEKLLAQAL